MSRWVRSPVNTKHCITFVQRRQMFCVYWARRYFSQHLLSAWCVPWHVRACNTLSRPSLSALWLIRPTGALGQSTTISRPKGIPTQRWLTAGPLCQMLAQPWATLRVDWLSITTQWLFALFIKWALATFHLSALMLLLHFCRMFRTRCLLSGFVWLLFVHR